MAPLLKLRAVDPDDLAVIAACLQDALVPIGEMAFLPQERRFVLVANRFRWEIHGPAESASPAAGDAPGDASFDDASYDEGGAPRFERSNCGVCFDGVLSVRTMGIDLKQRGRILDLLTVQAEPGAVLLVFAGGATIRLEQPTLSCIMEDIGEAWPTRWRPSHALDEDAHG